MHPAPIDRLAQRRRFSRTGRLSIAAAILLHLLAVAALLLVIREPPPAPDAAPSEVALLFEGGLRQASPLPPSERPSPAPLPSQTPGVDTQDSASSSPPPPAEISPPTPALPVPPVPPSELPPAREPPVPQMIVPQMPVPETNVPETDVPQATAPESASPAPSTAEAPNATTAPPDVAGNVPPPRAQATREPPAIASHPPTTRPTPPRQQPRPVARSVARPVARPVRPSQPRVTADGFPTTLFGSTDFSGHSSVTRHAALGAPPTPAAKSSAASDIHGGEDLGSDWMNEFSAYVERHKRYPEQAAQNNDEGDTTVQIVVNRDGHVEGRDVDLVGRSGSQWLDLGLMGMFRGARLPPFPPGAPRDQETITVTMHYYLTR